MSTLTLALAMTRLMNNKTVPWAPVNMVKFCWFGGEEAGLLGSNEVVRVAVEADKDPDAMPGSRARDWAIMVDLDMLGSMNFMNWVYDANVFIPASTPQRAWQGSKLLSNLFFEYFDQNNLPRDSDTFDGRSDYGPFLVSNTAALTRRWLPPLISCADLLLLGCVLSRRRSQAFPRAVWTPAPTRGRRWRRRSATSG